MKVHLMAPDSDFDVRAPVPGHAAMLEQDLEVATLVAAAAGEDKLIADVVRAALLTGPQCPTATVEFRQAVLRDCLANRGTVRELMRIATDAIEAERGRRFGIFGDWPATILHRSIEVMDMFANVLKSLRELAADHRSSFQSQGFLALFDMLEKELADDYLEEIRQHVRQLRFAKGVPIGAQLDDTGRGKGYTLLRPNPDPRGWMRWFLGPKTPSLIYRIPARDESGFRALSELQDRGINLAANALAQSVDHIVAFLTALRTELSFYVGCLNLCEALEAGLGPFCVPQITTKDDQLACTGLYDVCLALRTGQPPVGNDFDADGKPLVVITGANQGGKSTLLRAIGQSQLMMQCGMIVAASSYRSTACPALFTHFKREEDTTMTSGKLDEEMSRMSDIVSKLRAGAMVLFNESFAATNEREGSSIARAILRALMETQVRGVFVTHMYALAHGLFTQPVTATLFLRAERQPGGARTFKVKPGEPLETSYGKDLYERIFVSDRDQTPIMGRRKVEIEPVRNRP